eukprot:s594_g14.t1
MRRPAVEKGKTASASPIVLGRRVGGAPLPNLVAEPMEAPRAICFLRTFLTVLVTLILTFAGLEMLATDDAILVSQTTTEHSWNTTRDADDDIAYSLVTTNEPDAKAVMNFQLSMTLDVTIDAQDHMTVTLANQTGFYAAYRHDEYLRDGFSASFDKQRTRALTFVSAAMEQQSTDHGKLTTDRKLRDDVSTDSGFTDGTDGYHDAVMNSHASVIERFRRWCTMIKRVTFGRSSNWTLGLIVLVSGVMMTSVCYMHQQPFRPHPAQHGFRTHVHQSDAGPPFVGTATLKCPPSWCVERNHIYTLRAWISDLVLWASATELDAARHGPIAALQVQGSAKELIRELTPQQLQHGDVDPVTGQQLTGLMLLVTVLARRYAPLEAENTTKSIAEFLAFRRQPGETIDSLLVRFDILRNRAQNRAGFAVNLTGLTWLLLQSLGLSAESWDRLLAPLGGQMPQTDFEFGALMERIRRLFHLKEGRMQHGGGQGAMGDAGNFHTEGFFPTFCPEGPHAHAYVAGGPAAPDPWAAHHAAAAASNATFDQPGTSVLGAQAYASGSGSNECCPTCGNYFQDDGYSTDTSSDDGSSMPGENDDPVEAYLQYAFARKRWRRISNKYPRRYRKSFKGGKGFRSSTYAAFLPPNSFAGGKGGKGKSGSGFKKRNPKDKNGQTLKCNICQSEEHLWRNCPKRGQQGDGSYTTNAMPASGIHVAHAASQQQLALMPSHNMLWGPGQSTSLPGVHFFGTEMENLRSVSQAGSVVSSQGRKRSSVEDPEPITPNAPSRAAPRFSPSFFPSATTTHDPSVEPLIANAPQPVVPPPTEPAPATILLGVRRDAETALDEPEDAVVSSSPSASAKCASASQTAGVASVPNASVPNAFVGHSLASDDCAIDERSKRMSREEQQRLRDQNIAGLQDVLHGLDNRSEVGSAVGSQVSNPNAATGRHVLNLESRLVSQPAMVPMQFMPQVPNPHMHAMPQMPNAIPNAVWPSHVSCQFPQPGQGSTAQPSAGFPGNSSLDPRSGSYPWWEVAEKQDDEIRNAEGSYHLRTRRRDGTVGLLVDPGAHDNLIGGLTAQQMCSELKAQLHLRSMNKPLPVEGVGKAAQVADQAACIPMSVMDVFGKLTDATYTAPIIQDSMLPPLLGNRTLRKMQVIMDCGSGKLIIPGPGGIEVKMSPGSRVYDLELTNSGHWVLPLHARTQVASKTADEKELAFNMSCRRDRSQTPDPRRRDAATSN